MISGALTDQEVRSARIEELKMLFTWNYRNCSQAWSRSYNSTYMGNLSHYMQGESEIITHLKTGFVLFKRYDGQLSQFWGMCSESSQVYHKPIWVLLFCNGNQIVFCTFSFIMNCNFILLYS